MDGRKCRGANLQDIDLVKADLVRANFAEANLSSANLSGAKYNADTTWPEGFDPVAAGAELVED